MSISQGNLITATDVNNHINNKSNPHEVTAAQSGAVIANFGYIDNADLIAWATAQTQSCFFAVNPNVTTTNVPVAGQWYSGILNVGNGLKSIILISLTTGNIYYNRTISSVFQTWSQSSKEGHTHSNYATIAYVDQAIANSGPEMQAWNISKSETNDGKTTYVYFNTADTTIKQFEIYFSNTPTYKYFSSNDYYNGSWKAADSVKLAANGGSTLIFDNRGAKYFKTSGGRLYLQFEDDDLGGCTLIMNLIVYIYR